MSKEISQRRDKRLRNKSWRKRTGFDNIDPKPNCKVTSPRKEYVSPAERDLDLSE